LDVADGRVVKGVNFADLSDVGDPVELARRYDAEGADEVTFLDVSATVEGRSTMLHVGHVADLLNAGADKVGVNSAAVARPALVAEIAERFGRQVLVLSIDARRGARHGAPTGSGFEVTTHGGRRGTGIDAIEWAETAVRLGAGEILLNSIDADGTRDGFDLAMIRAVREVVDVPVIASGGAGEPGHFAPAVAAGADAVLAASVFHFAILSIAEVKAALAAAGTTVR